jgi:hypothetical protein
MGSRSMVGSAQKKTYSLQEFKRTMDLRPSFQAKAEDRANKQHEWLTKTLTRAVAEKGWEVQTVIFTGGTMGSVKIDKFEHNLTALEVKKKEWATIRKMHARTLLEAHDTVLRAYYEALYASHTPVTQHRHHFTSMSMYRSNNSEAQDTGKATPGAIARAIRMRVNERPKFLKRRQGRLKSTNHWERNHSENGEDRCAPQLLSKHFWMKTI